MKTVEKLLQMCVNHMSERETYEEAISTDDLISEIQNYLSASHPTLPSDEEIYKVEARRMPIGDTGDYDSWLELITPNFNLSCYDSNVEFEEIKKLADKLNFAEYASAKITEMERKKVEFRELARLVSALNEEHEHFKSIAGHIKLARKLLTTTTP